MQPLDVFEFDAFDTINSIEVFKAVEGFDVRALIDALSTIVQESERIFSPTRPDSVLSKVNEMAGHPVEAEDEFLATVEAGLHYCDLSGGLFDITVGPVLRLWNFKEGKSADNDRLEQALRHVGHDCVHVDRRLGQILISDPEARIDLGGIAKGRIADRMKACMVDHGVSSALINLGGNVLAIGSKPDGSPWTVGVRRPRHGVSEEASSLHRDEFVAAVGIVNQSVVTSGTYERAFVDDRGALRHHIIDPRTGYPAETDVVSCTVIAPSSMEADGLSTAPIIMGTKKAVSFLEGIPDIEGIVIGSDGSILLTSGLAR